MRHYGAGDRQAQARHHPARCVQPVRVAGMNTTSIAVEELEEGMEIMVGAFRSVMWFTGMMGEC